MKASRLFLMLLLSISLLVTSTAQAFCFSFGSKHDRPRDYYNRPMPAVGFAPQQYYAYPYSAVPVSPWYGNGGLVIPPDPQGSGQQRGGWGWSNP